jgi:hypothetical protein
MSDCTEPNGLTPHACRDHEGQEGMPAEGQA